MPTLSFKGCHFQHDMILQSVRWYLADSLIIDQCDANHAAVKQVNRDMKKRITIRQCKYLNTIIEQDHQRIKRNRAP